MNQNLTLSWLLGLEGVFWVLERSGGRSKSGEDNRDRGESWEARKPRERAEAEKKRGTRERA